MIFPVLLLFMFFMRFDIFNSILVHLEILALTIFYESEIKMLI